MTQSAIIVPIITEFVAETRVMLASLAETEATIGTLGQAMEQAQQLQRAQWMLVGRQLLKVRASLPKRSNTNQGWIAFLEACELAETSARRYMNYAEGTLSATPGEQLPSMGDLGLTKREGPEPDPDAPPPTDQDAPAPEDASPVIEVIEPAIVAPANRDAWCTPEILTLALPHVDVDPCSNPYSSVRADTTYMLEAGQDGLSLPWFGLVFVNGPYSKLLPWAARLAGELGDKRSKVKGAGFLVNTANTPEWWHMLTKYLPLRLDFNERLEFKPPPGVEPSRNDRDQCLLMNAAFWKKCNRKALLAMGTLWERA